MGSSSERRRPERVTPTKPRDGRESNSSKSKRSPLRLPPSLPSLTIPRRTPDCPDSDFPLFDVDRDRSFGPLTLDLNSSLSPLSSPLLLPLDADVHRKRNSRLRSHRPRVFPRLRRRRLDPNRTYSPFLRSRLPSTSIRRTRQHHSNWRWTGYSSSERDLGRDPLLARSRGNRNFGRISPSPENL